MLLLPLAAPSSSHAALHRGSHSTQLLPCSSSSSSSSSKRARRPLLLLVRCVAPVQEDVSSSSSGGGTTSSSTSNGTAAAAAAAVTTPAPPRAGTTPSCLPEDLQLPPGELSTIDRVGQGLDVDVFRCFGCTKQECKVRAIALVPQEVH